MENMKIAIGIAGVVGATVLGAVPAHADPSTFIMDMAAAGYYTSSGDNDHMLSIGYHLCTEIASGMTPSAVAFDLYANTGMSISRSDASEVVQIAIRDLCPRTSIT